MSGYLIKRTNITADGEVTVIGKRFICGSNAEPYDTVSSAESALKRQEKQDQEYCSDCIIIYKIIKAEEQCCMKKRA